MGKFNQIDIIFILARPNMPTYKHTKTYKQSIAAGNQIVYTGINTHIDACIYVSMLYLIYFIIIFFCFGFIWYSDLYSI